MPDGVDDLDGEALEIATKYLLDRWTLKQLASKYHRSPATLHRRLTKWLDSGRFELTDTRTEESVPRVVGINDRLSDALSGRTHIWRAHVAVDRWRRRRIFGKLSGARTIAPKHNEHLKHMTGCIWH